MHRLAVDRVQISLDHIVTNIADQPLLQRGVKVHLFYAGKQIGLLNILQYLFAGVQRQLTAVRPINLITVIFGGVVAGRYYHAGVAVQRPHRIRQHRRWHQFFIKVHSESVGGEYLCRCFCK